MVKKFDEFFKETRDKPLNEFAPSTPATVVPSAGSDVGAGAVPADPLSPQSDEEDIPALFATIHFKSDARPNGYTPEDIEELNRLANSKRKPQASED